MIKKIVCLLVIGCTALVATAQEKITPSAKGVTYGEVITAQNAFSVSKLEGKMNGAETMDAKVKGKVVEVCEKKGCFMKLETASGQAMMVKFKDYGFFVPTDLKGKTVVIEGLAKQEVMSVEKQKHYAEDAKKSKEEIAKITEPKKQVTFEAKGVVVL